MAWKIEKWLSDVFPGPSHIYEEYRNLTRRELAIVAAGVLDLGLAQLLSIRLAGDDREREEFLGLSGDGRAPAGTALGHAFSWVFSQELSRRMMPRFCGSSRIYAIASLIASKWTSLAQRFYLLPANSARDGKKEPCGLPSQVYRRKQSPQE